MKIHLSCLLALFVTASAMAQSKFHAGAGVSHLELRNADFAQNPAHPHTVLRNDKSAWAPYLEIGYELTERLRIRFSYLYADDVISQVARVYPTDPDAEVVERHANDIHVLTLAPEWTWRASGSVSISLSPGVNWVSMREGRVFGTPTQLSVIPSASRTESGFTFGASAGMAWSLSDRWALSFRYSFIDLDPSWNRHAHAFSGGLRARF